MLNTIDNLNRLLESSCQFSLPIFCGQEFPTVHKMNSFRYQPEGRESILLLTSHGPSTLQAFPSALLPSLIMVCHKLVNKLKTHFSSSDVCIDRSGCNHGLNSACV